MENISSLSKYLLQPGRMSRFNYHDFKTFHERDLSDLYSEKLQTDKKDESPHEFLGTRITEVQEQEQENEDKELTEDVRDTTTPKHDSDDEIKNDRGKSTDEDKTKGSKEDERNSETFVAVIAQAILSVPTKRMTLSSIYNFIARNYPHFDKEKGPGWRNSVRHNLSSNDCFVKASRAENGKGHYWMIHPKDLPEFSKGNFRRPRKPRRPRCSHALGCGTDRSMLGLPLSATLFPYHHKPSHSLELTKPHPPKEPFPHPFGVTPNRSPLLPTSRYDYYSREAAETAHFPMNQYHGFSTPPPPYGLFSWQDNPAFRNYNPHFQSSSFHPYLYMSPVSQSENGIGINYA